MPEKILPRFNKVQANLIVKRLREVLGPEVTAIMDKSGINPDHMVRFQYISSLCINARKQKQISLKQISEKLKIPQYRLKDIESINIKTIIPNLLEKYIEFLGLTDAFCDWRKDNEDIYKSIQDNLDK
jgi:hypothetical protein